MVFFLALKWLLVGRCLINASWFYCRVLDADRTGVSGGVWMRLIGKLCEWSLHSYKH